MSNSNNNSNESPKQKEIYRVQTLLDDIHRIGRTCRNNNVYFSDHESKVFNKYQYYSFTAAFVGTSLSFVLLFGGCRYWSYRTFLKRQQTFHNYQWLDLKQPSAQSPPPSDALLLKQKVQAQTEQFSLMDDSMTCIIQTLLSLCGSVVMGSLVGNYFVDKHQYLQNLSQLPLQPGHSVFGDRTCTFLLKQTFPPDNDIVTTDLELMKQWQYNCQLRRRYLQFLQRQNPDLTEIPSPGVPRVYANTEQTVKSDQ